MDMSPWLSVVLLGVAVFGFAWLSPKAKPGDDAGPSADAAYDRLLEDLETENRELVDAVAQFKQEQDETVNRLVKQIVELERQMKQLSEQSPASGTTVTYVAAVPPAAAAQTAAARPDSADRQEGPIPPAPQAAAPSAPLGSSEAEESRYQPTSVRERYAELLTLHHKGRSVEQIAKSVGMNKGEVQLILQLARREEDQHA